MYFVCRSFSELRRCRPGLLQVQGCQTRSTLLIADRMWLLILDLFHRRTRSAYVCNGCLAWYDALLIPDVTQAWNTVSYPICLYFMVEWMRGVNTTYIMSDIHCRHRRYKCNGEINWCINYTSHLLIYSLFAYKMKPTPCATYTDNTESLTFIHHASRQAMYK